MSRIVYPDDGLPYVLNRQLNTPGPQADPANWYFGLFTNNVVPDRSYTLGMLLEATFGGYARIALSALTPAAATLAANVASSVLLQAVFTWSGGAAENVYGWFLYDNVVNHLIAVALLDDGPISLTLAGQRVRFTPTLQLASRESVTP